MNRIEDYNYTIHKVNSITVELVEIETGEGIDKMILDMSFGKGFYLYHGTTLLSFDLKGKLMSFKPLEESEKKEEIVDVNKFIEERGEITFSDAYKLKHGLPLDMLDEVLTIPPKNAKKVVIKKEETEFKKLVKDLSKLSPEEYLGYLKQEQKRFDRKPVWVFYKFLEWCDSKNMKPYKEHIVDIGEYCGYKKSWAEIKCEELNLISVSEIFLNPKKKETLMGKLKKAEKYEYGVTEKGRAITKRYPKTNRAK